MFGVMDIMQSQVCFKRENRSMATIVMISKEKMSANKFFFKDAESNTSGLLNRGRFSRFNLKKHYGLILWRGSNVSRLQSH